MNKKILLVDCGSDYIIDLERSLTSLDCDVVRIKFFELSNIDSEIDEIVISGSPTLLTEVGFKPYYEKMDLILKSKKPLLGVCFGHQLLGMYYGSKISIGEKRVDMVDVKWVDSSDLFRGFELNHAEFGQWHREEIDLPEDFICIASSSQTSIEAMKHKDLHFYGVQFHPEISGKNGLLLLKNFLKLLE